VPVPWQLVRTPRVSRRFAAALKLSTYIRSLSDPPRQRYSARTQPWDLDSCVQTRSCRIGKVRPSAHVSRRGRSREEDIYVQKYALVCTPATLLSPTTLDKHKRPSAVICDTRKQKQGPQLHGVQGLDRRRSKGGGAVECNKAYGAVVYLPKSTPPCGLRAPLQSLATARVHGRGEEIEGGERRGCGAVLMRGCGGMAVLLYASRNSQ
jgi:hypothetical protein